jgi:subtilase family serine protease
MRSIEKRPAARRLLLKAALAVGVLGTLVGAASAVAAGPTTPVSYKAVCAAVPVGHARCMSYVVTNKAGVPQVSPKAVSGYGPAQFQGAYGLAAAASASTSEVVAIVDAFHNPNAKSDLDTYSTNFGLPVMPVCSGAPAAGCFKQVNQTGGSTPPAGDTGWGLEIALDVQTVHAVCPHCGILLVEANSNGDTDLYTAVDYAAAHANVVSNSWSGGEYSGETSDDSHFNHPGVAITVSTGDSGYWGNFFTQYPPSSRYVTAVGGTSLNLNGANQRTSETVWDGAGSGCSRFETKPTWQKDTGCSRRTAADVSADADPNTGAAVYDTYGYSGWLQVGGTSLAAPLIGAVYALANVGGTSDYPSSYPYAHTSSLFDVTSGSNGSCSVAYLCTGVTGYDGPTGLGSPIGTTAFASGGGGGGGGNPPTVTSFSPTSGAVGTSVTINGTNFTGVTAVKFNTTAATTYTVNSATKITATVPSGATTGPISVSNGDGTGTSASSFTVTGGGGGGGSAPKITGFSPAYGFTGSRVIINGSNFTGATSVKLGTASASFTVTSPSRITATVPALSRGTYKWSVTTPGGTATSTGNFFHF